MMTPEQQSSAPRCYAYLIVFSGLSRSAFQRHIDAHGDVFQNWTAAFENALFVVSAESAVAITRFLRANVPQLDTFVVFDAATDRNGYLPERLWSFIDHPRPA